VEQVPPINSCVAEYVGCPATKMVETLLLADWATPLIKSYAKIGLLSLALRGPVAEPQASGMT
jgi:hypothetical protein